MLPEPSWLITILTTIASFLAGLKCGIVINFNRYKADTSEGDGL